MNERGIASLTAMIILLMLAYSIRGTNFTAGNLVDMTRNFEVENQLQLAAESALERKLLKFKLGENLSSEERTAAFVDEVGADNGIKYIVTAKSIDGRIYPRSSLSKPINAVFILSVAKKENYFGKGINAYRSVSCFLEETNETSEGEEPVTKYKYVFKGYLHKTIKTS